jgi:DNA polymerase-1
MNFRIVVDFSHLAYRNWCTTGELSTNAPTEEQREKTGVIFGVVRSLRMLCDKYKPTEVIFAADRGRSFRKDILVEYKASRGAKTEEEARNRDDFYEQCEKCEAVLESLGVPVVGVDQMEADDICAIICEKIPFDGRNIVVSGDKDLLQLVSPRTMYFHPLYDKMVAHDGARIADGISSEQLGEFWAKNKIIDPYTFTYKSEKLRKGVPFERWMLYRAMVGDHSDELPGIPGIGETTAFNIVSNCGSIEEVIQQKDTLPGLNKRQREALKEDDLRLQYNLIDLKLVTEFDQVPQILQVINNARLKCRRDIKMFERFLIRYQMSSISSDLTKFLRNIPCAVLTA